MVRHFFIILFLMIFATIHAAQKSLHKVKVKVEAAGVVRQNTIVSFDITNYSPIPAGSQIVVKMADGRICPSQAERCPEKNTATLYWRVDGVLTENESRIFAIEISLASMLKNEAVAAPTSTPVMNIEKDRVGNLILKMSDKDVLRYNTVPPALPGYIDPVYRRNGFIHPAWSPVGNVLTNVSPTDHFHHYGIWNPWTSVEYAGRHYDLWNVGDKTGTVSFDSLISLTTGGLYADILVRHRHIIYESQKEQVTNHVWGIMRFTPKIEKIIMDELQHIRVWNIEEGAFVWDLNFSLFPSTNLPVILKEYRYAGLGWRATPDWTKDNCEMMTSEGKTRQQIDGTNARWIFVTGVGPNGKSGILFMASPKNHNFPEPLRIWDETQNGGRGDG